MKNVLIYMDEPQLKDPEDSSLYVANTMKNSYSSEFNVKISTKPDASLAQKSDIIFCRFEIPIKKDFLKQLSQYDDGTRLFINPPLTKLNYVDKSYLKRFIGTGLLPETIITKNVSEIAYFMKQNTSYVISKPLNENGGNGIEKINVKGKSINELEEIARNLTNNEEREMILQEFIKKVASYGDKRVNLVFGTPANCFLRFPKKGSYKCNVHAGGSIVKSELTKKDQKILERTLPFIKEINANWVGVDIIGPYLGEINISSPGGLCDGDILNQDSKGITTLIDKLK